MQLLEELAVEIYEIEHMNFWNYHRLATFKGSKFNNSLTPRFDRLRGKYSAFFEHLWLRLLKSDIMGVPPKSESSQPSTSKSPSTAQVPEICSDFANVRYLCYLLFEMEMRNTKFTEILILTF